MPNETTTNATASTPATGTPSNASSTPASTPVGSASASHTHTTASTSTPAGKSPAPSADKTGASSPPPPTAKGEPGQGGGTSNGTQSTTNKPKTLTPEEIKALPPAQASERAAVAYKKSLAAIAEAEAKGKAKDGEIEALKAQLAAKDAELTKHAKAIAAAAHFSSGKVVQGIKEMLADGYDHAEIMTAIALDAPDVGEDGKPKPTTKHEPTVAEQIAAALKAAEAAKEAERKRVEDEARATAAAAKDAERAATRAHFTAEVKEALTAEAHPLLWEKVQASLDLFPTEADAWKAFGAKVIDKYLDVEIRRRKGEIQGDPLTPGETVALMELEAKRAREAKNPKPRTPEDDLADAFKELDKQFAAEATPLLVTRPPASKKPEEMTPLELAYAELDRMDAKKGPQRVSLEDIDDA